MSFEFKIILPENAVSAFESAFEEIAGAVLTRLLEKGKHIGHWEFQVIFEHKPSRENIKKIIRETAQRAGIKSPILRVRQIPEINWLEASYHGFPPIEVGPYYIYGSHIKEIPPADKITLQIDAATAFGTGEHQTTHGCLKALTELSKTPESVLDVGCGSGILGMAFAKTYHRPTDAVDIDPESVRVAKNNVIKNDLNQWVTVWQSNGYEKIHKNYDLIFCNILATPLVEMAKDLSHHLKHDGIAILSGFLYDQEDLVQKAHEKAGLYFVRRYRINGWTTLVMKKD